MLDGGCQVTWIVWLRPHSNNIPICNSRRTDIQSCPWQWLLACWSLEETEPSVAQGCKFCPSAQCSLSGRTAADNGTLFTAEGKGNFKGVAHMLLIGRMITGKENWIERRGPGFFPQNCLLSIAWMLCTLLSRLSQMCRWVTLKWSQAGRHQEREGGVVSWPSRGQPRRLQSPFTLVVRLQAFSTCYKTNRVCKFFVLIFPSLLMGYSLPLVWIKEGAVVQWDQKICPGEEMNPWTPRRDLWPQVTWDWGLALERVWAGRSLLSLHPLPLLLYSLPSHHINKNSRPLTLNICVPSLLFFQADLSCVPSCLMEIFSWMPHFTPGSTYLTWNTFLLFPRPGPLQTAWFHEELISENVKCCGSSGPSLH